MWLAAFVCQRASCDGCMVVFWTPSIVQPVTSCASSHPHTFRASVECCLVHTLHVTVACSLLSTLQRQIAPAAICGLCVHNPYTISLRHLHTAVHDPNAPTGLFWPMTHASICRSPPYLWRLRWCWCCHQQSPSSLSLGCCTPGSHPPRCDGAVLPAAPYMMWFGDLSAM